MKIIMMINNKDTNRSCIYNVIRRSTNMIEKTRNVSFLLLLTITILTKINNALIIALNPLNPIRISTIYRSHGTTMLKKSFRTSLLLSSSIDNDIDEINWDEINDDVKTTRTSTIAPEQTKSYKDIAEENIQRAIQNKKKREPKQDQKRRLLMYVKEKQRIKKRSGYVKRPIPLRQRQVLLSDLQPGMILNGTVISMTSFGAYIDIGTQVDGLLHISQLTHETFIEHPKQFLNIGQELNVTIRSYSIEKKKLHLTLLPFDLVQDDIRYNQNDNDNYNNNQNDDNSGDVDVPSSSDYPLKYVNNNNKIPLNDIQIDDELWGIIKRVTNYGAYIDVGATVLGFLHFMDHPLFEYGTKPKDFMFINDRIRCWVLKNNIELNRIQLTCIRPKNLPGPRRE